VDPAGLSLVAIMLVWQMPHSLALAWMYKDDYAKGGYRLLPVVTPDGTQTAWHAWFWTLALVPVTLLPAYFLSERVGIVYIALAAITGAFFVHAGWKFFKARDRASARRLFFVSIIQLPLLFAALVGETLVRMMLR
jgi:protoheme IX farnesyltransferase